MFCFFLLLLLKAVGRSERVFIFCKNKHAEPILHKIIFLVLTENNSNKNKTLLIILVKYKS